MKTATTKLPIPFGDRVLVRRFEPETVSPGGITIPVSERDRPNRARVLRNWGESLKKDDIVLFREHAGVEVGYDNLLILEAKEIVAVLP